jgi:hypothetical protein
VTASPQDSTVASGRIVAADGRPISGAQVLLVPTDAPQAQARAAVSDGDGAYQFVLPNDRGGTFRIVASRSGYVRAFYGQRECRPR